MFSEVVELVCVNLQASPKFEFDHDGLARPNVVDGPAAVVFPDFISCRHSLELYADGRRNESVIGQTGCGVH
jgi:hypothetical protein